MVGSFLAPKWPILVPFCEMNHQKPNFSLISDTLSVGACWGQNMLLFKILVDETQTPQSQDFKSTFKQILVCIFLSVRDNLENTFHCETPCSTFILKKHEMMLNILPFFKLLLPNYTWSSHRDISHTNEISSESPDIWKSAKMQKTKIALRKITSLH